MIPLEINVTMTGEDVTAIVCIVMVCLIVIALIRNM